MTRKRVAILISGRGSNMTALVEAARAPDYPAQIVGVFSNRADAPGLQYAWLAGIPTAVLSHKDYPDKPAFEAAMDAALAAWQPDILCLAGFMRLLSPGFCTRWAGRLINIHPSLLPLHKGLHTHQQALADGVAEHGCTVHFVTPGMDEGPTIAQARVPLLPGDTAETLAARVLVEEHKLYPLALAMLARGEVSLPVESAGPRSTSSKSTFTDDDLTHLEAHGLPPLPEPATSGFADNDNARIWYAAFGDGPPVVLLHGGLGNAGNWAYQVPALVGAGYRAIVVDSRGQGRSSRDDRPYSYEVMASDVRAVMDALGVAKAAFVGWSDGADTALVLSKQTPERSAGVFFFACNVDASGPLPFVFTERIGRIYNRHVADYAALSPTPEQFEKMRDDLGVMQREQPSYSAADLASVAVPVWSVLGEHDEFIRREHAQYIARAIPGARFVLLPEVSHFAPLQRPEAFNAVVLDFLRRLRW
jgi:formyltetrahydrofolate-dependent phosphoribosylglycinamide formyltransferase